MTEKEVINSLKCAVFTPYEIAKIEEKLANKCNSLIYRPNVPYPKFMVGKLILYLLDTLGILVRTVSFEMLKKLSNILAFILETFSWNNHMKIILEKLNKLSKLSPEIMIYLSSIIN